MPVGTLPIVPYNAPITQNNLEYNGRRDSRETQSTRGSYGQFYPLRNIVVQDDIDMRLLSEDPFFLLASLSTTSALSFVQLLNYLSESIAESGTTDTEMLEVELERLQHSTSIIHHPSYRTVAHGKPALDQTRRLRRVAQGSFYRYFNAQGTPTTKTSRGP